ncbi:MAG: gfo/Idh/MocA family oxidoreductase [Chitinivibrionales bacterium]|nr:gfo/Idh/MocA family oxidoreductase [Chitinivibrionales bacterium]
MAETIRFGLIGLGLMGREFASATARWCNLRDNLPTPQITGICSRSGANHDWFKSHFPTITVETNDYRKLLDSKEIDAIYCAVPHDRHEAMYIDTLDAGKHLLGEKPFGIDKAANEAILDAVRTHPDLVVRCSSEFPYFPGAQRLIQWIAEGRAGRIMEVRAGFHHSSDMDLNKPINWKRSIATNGEYGCMGDLGMHTQHIPFRMGWVPGWVHADLQNIAETRPDGTGGSAACETWDNAKLTCRCVTPQERAPFSLVLETKRMAPGQTNTWFIDVYGTDGSASFSTRDPRTFRFLETTGGQQAWSRLDLGMGPLAFPVVTGGIFEPGFADCFQQMLAAYVNELAGNPKAGVFGCVTPEETRLSHHLMTAALESERTGSRVNLDTEA